ncbi:MAG TPA: hypothetical protein VFS77_02455 [Pyrinomonadaceae bacterium]|nr:hypothetical protein [Pyrinomonadaceae bacterium]
MRTVSLIILILVISGTNFANQSKRVSLIRSPKTLALAQAFKSGKLPEPARLPKGSIDQQAAALAKAVATGDESSTASLYAAILAAGYGVRDTDKSVMQTTENGQGLILDASEVAAMAKLYGEDYGVTLAHLSESFTRSVPQFKTLPLANNILEAIRNATKSNHNATRFWARFIVELGKNSAAPYDLSRQIDPARVRLDAIQVPLILSRLAGELAATGKRNAGHHPLPASQSPCGGSDVQDLISDYNALASTTLFGFLTDRMGGAAASYADVAGIANVVLTVFKFIISYASLEVEITMDGDHLIRTKSNKPGETRTLKAKLKMDPGKWETINCLRPALNAAGLDVDVPGSGPLAGVNVVWVMVMGGDSRGWVGTVEDIFKIMGGEAAWGDGIVFFDPVPGADRSPAKQFTNGEGESEMRVVGIPQDPDLSRRKVLEVIKGAGVRVDVQLKPMRIVDKKQGLATLMDIVENAFSFLTKDPAGGAVGTITETLYRSNWYSSQPFYFIVKDWEPCQGQWQGTITYRVISKREGTAESNVNVSYWNDNAYYESRAVLDGRRTEEGAPIARVEAHASEVKEWGGRGKGVCYRETHQSRTLKGQTTETTTAFSIIVNPRTREYSVSAPTPIVIGSGESTVRSDVKGTCNNPYNKNVSNSNPEEGAKMSDDAPNLIGKGFIDPAKPDEISGTDTTKHATVRGEKTVTITWNLRRCADQ